jgi:hypothetical protein
MNTNNVVSAVGAVDLTGKEFHVVKLATNGIDLASSGDVAIGTLQRGQTKQEDGVYLGKAVAVQLKDASVHFAVVGASTAAVARGAGLILDSANPGRLVPSESSPICKAWDAFTAINGAIVQVIFL